MSRRPVSPSKRSCFGSQCVRKSWTGPDGLLTTLFFGDFFEPVNDQEDRQYAQAEVERHTADLSEITDLFCPLQRSGIHMSCL